MESVINGDTSGHKSYISDLGNIFLKCRTVRISELSAARKKEFYYTVVSL